MVCSIKRSHAFYPSRAGIHRLPANDSMTCGSTQHLPTPCPRHMTFIGALKIRDSGKYLFDTFGDAAKQPQRGRATKLTAKQPVPNHTGQQELGSMYCADPNCEYCKELRKAVEQVRNNARRGT